MNFKSSVSAEVKKILEKKKEVRGEAQTKKILIEPFLKVLGYDIENIKIFKDEYAVDNGKNGEKVDYAVFKDKNLFILIEAKNRSENLDNHISQLKRYFDLSNSAKLGILTNGIEYKFFTDLNAANKMDKEPFLTINIKNLNSKDHSKDLEILKSFVYQNLNAEKIKNIAIKSKYCQELQEILKKEFENPSDEFVKILTKKIALIKDKKMTNSVLKEFKGYVKEALKHFVENKIKHTNKENSSTNETKEKVLASKDTKEAFDIIKSILAEAGANLSELTCKETYNYAVILYQNKSSKWICRLFFNCTQKKIEFPNKKIQNIDKIEDIYKAKDLIIKAYKGRR